MAPATRRTLSKVKSSAMTARQPSVPNLIAVVGCWSLVGGVAGLVIEGSAITLSLGSQGIGERPTTNDQRRFSHQLLQFLLIQILHHFADVLRIFSGSDKQCVFRFHH